MNWWLLSKFINETTAIAMVQGLSCRLQEYFVLEILHPSNVIKFPTCLAPCVDPAVQTHNSHDHYGNMSLMHHIGAHNLFVILPTLLLRELGHHDDRN